MVSILKRCLSVKNIQIRTCDIQFSRPTLTHSPPSHSSGRACNVYKKVGEGASSRGNQAKDSNMYIWKRKRILKIARIFFFLHLLGLFFDDNSVSGGERERE